MKVMLQWARKAAATVVSVELLARQSCIIMNVAHLSARDTASLHSI